MTSLKTSWAISLSPLFVLRKFPIKGVADGCRLRKGCGKIAKLGLRCAKLGYSWPSISTCGWLPSDLRNFLTRIDLGRMIIDPRPSFQTVWLNQKCWYPKNAEKDVECRMKGCPRMAKRQSWVIAYIAGHQSALSTCGSRMVALKAFWHALTWGRPASFFPKQFTVRGSQFFLKMCPPLCDWWCPPVLSVSCLPSFVSLHVSP